MTEPSENKSSTKIYDSCAVARHIIEKHKQEHIYHLGITKLIKLVYISHGYTLGKEGRSLIEDTVETWDYGPAIRELYGAIRQAVSRSEDVNDWLSEYKRKAAEIEKDDKKIIDTVINKYRDSTATDLTTLTHQNGSPWHTAARSGDLTISNDLIRKYYEEHALCT